jgi:hypothetical protein
MAESLVGGDDAATVAIYAALMYDVISATNSSPQTTEINATARADTLMKWVKIGMAQGVLFIGIGMFIERPGKRWRPALGGGLAAVLLWIQYCHAKNAGLRNGGQGTEQYGQYTTPAYAKAGGNAGDGLRQPWAF